MNHRSQWSHHGSNTSFIQHDPSIDGIWHKYMGMNQNQSCYIWGDEHPFTSIYQLFGFIWGSLGYLKVLTHTQMIRLSRSISWSYLWIPANCWWSTTERLPTVVVLMNPEIHEWCGEKTMWGMASLRLSWKLACVQHFRACLMDFTVCLIPCLLIPTSWRFESL